MQKARCAGRQNSAWGRLLSEREVQLVGCAQNLRMQGQSLDRDKFVRNKFECV